MKHHSYSSHTVTVLLHIWSLTVVCCRYRLATLKTWEQLLWETSQTCSCRKTTPFWLAMQPVIIQVSTHAQLPAANILRFIYRTQELGAPMTPPPNYITAL